MRTKHIMVSGRVHGVFFRSYALEQAKTLGIKGFVRNLPTGKVEILAQGERLEEFIRVIHRGPPSAKVDEVKIDDVDEPEVFDEFLIH